eukprot:351960-Chlamydomonas_euryale.AAC.1
MGGGGGDDEWVPLGRSHVPPQGDWVPLQHLQPPQRPQQPHHPQHFSGTIYTVRSDGSVERHHSGAPSAVAPFVSPLDAVSRPQSAAARADWVPLGGGAGMPGAAAAATTRQAAWAPLPLPLSLARAGSLPASGGSGRLSSPDMSGAASAHQLMSYGSGGSGGGGSSAGGALVWPPAVQGAGRGPALAWATPDQQQQQQRRLHSWQGVGRFHAQQHDAHARARDGGSGSGGRRMRPSTAGMPWAGSAPRNP